MSWLTCSDACPHAHCSPEKTAALADAVLDVVDRCDALIEGGSTASEIEELDFSALLRAAQETPPDDSAGIAGRRQQVLDELEALR